MDKPEKPNTDESLRARLHAQIFTGQQYRLEACTYIDPHSDNPNPVPQEGFKKVITPEYAQWLQQVREHQERELTSEEIAAYKAMTLAEKASFDQSRQRVAYRDDGKESVTFEIHLPRGILAKRMSAWELRDFLLAEMQPIAGLLTHFKNPRIVQDWMVLFYRLLLWPEQCLDEIVAWVKPVPDREADSLIVLDLGARKVDVGPSHFVLGGK